MSGEADAPEGDNPCFGCAEAHPKGLRLCFEEVADEVRSAARLGAEYASHPGVVHGGLVATLLDEVMAQAAYRRAGSPVFTVGLRVRYLEPMSVDVAHQVSARVLEQHPSFLKVRGTVSRDGVEIAVAEATFRATAQSRYAPPA